MKCVLCDAELPTESKNKYCKSCEIKWLKNEVEHIKNEYIPPETVQMIFKEKNKQIKSLKEENARLREILKQNHIYLI